MGCEMQNSPVDIAQVVEECKEHIREYGQWLIGQPREVVESEYEKYSRSVTKPAKILSDTDLNNKTISCYGKELVNLLNQMLREDIGD